MRKMVEPAVPSELYGDVLLEFLVDAATHYGEQVEWRVPTIAEHFEHDAIDETDAEVIETCEFLAWRCEHARLWLEAQHARGRPEHELTWQHCITETGVVEPDGRYRHQASR